MAEWTRAFFAGVWLDLQRSFWRAEDTENQAALVQRTLALRPHARVLDVPCGTGRLTVALARRGHSLTGVDFTPAFLAEAAAAAAEARGAAGALPVTFVERDMRDLGDLSGFDAAFNYWGSFGYFDDAGDQAFAAGVCRALVPGGRFLIEGHVMETLLPQFQTRGWSKVADTYVLEDRTFDATTSRLEVDWTFLRRPGEDERKHISMRLYSSHELAALLQRAGFTSVRLLDGHTEAPLAIGSRRALVIATK